MPLSLRSAPMNPDPAIFKAYDCRGLYGEQIDADVAHAIGRAFARVLADLAGKPTGEPRARRRRRGQLDAAVARAIGRAFARVLADLAGKPTGELRVGLGRDMRLTA